eukprot:gene25085-33600_t
MWLNALLITVQSFLLGYSYTSLNSCLVTGDKNSANDCYTKADTTCPKGTIYNDINLSTDDAQLATALTIVGAWIGCSLLGSAPAERFGRKMTVLGTNLFFIIGGLVAASGSIYGLFIGRLISGLGVGIACVVPPVLLSEIATAETRGTVTTLHQVMLTLAIFTATILGYGMVTYVNHGWQYIQAFSAIPAVGMLLLHRFIPESPKWMLASAAKESLLARKSQEKQSATFNALVSPDEERLGLGEDTEVSVSVSRPDINALSELRNYEEVVAVLRMLRPADNFHFNVDKEIFSILADAKKDAAIKVFASRKAVIIGCGLMFFQAITGVNSFGRKIMSTRLRSKAMSLFLSINWACNLLIGFLTLTAINDLGGVQSDMTDDQTAAAEKKGVAYLYFIFAGFTVLAIAFIHIFVPETKGGMTPGDIQQDETVHEKLIT